MQRSLAVLVALFLVALADAHGQEPSGSEVVRGYSSGGRIKWAFPKGFEYYLAVPHFTMGARIKCKGRREECEIQVLSRDLRKSIDDRARELSHKLASDAHDSAEGEVRIRTRGTQQKIIYATLTDPRPTQEFRLLTVGYAEKGPGLIQFHQLANEEVAVERLLRLVEDSVALDTLEVWAWRLEDYKAVCATRFPSYAQANAEAFASSAFGSVDVVSALRPQFPPEKSMDEIRVQLEKSRAAFARSFNSQSLNAAESTCRDFPKLVSEASKGLPSK